MKVDMKLIERCKENIHSTGKLLGLEPSVVGRYLSETNSPFTRSALMERVESITERAMLGLLRDYHRIITEFRDKRKEIGDAGMPFLLRAKEVAQRTKRVCQAALWENEGRAFDLRIECEFLFGSVTRWYDFPTPDDYHDIIKEKGSSALIGCNLSKHDAGKVSVKVVVRPSWLTRVGKARAIEVINGRKVFNIDSIKLDNPVLNEKGISCYKMFGFGTVSEKELAQMIRCLDDQIKLLEEQDDYSLHQEINTKIDQLSKVEKHMALPVSRTYYRLESELGISASATTIDGALNLLNRRLKTETLKALEL